MSKLNKIRVRNSFSFATGTSRYRHPRIPDANFLYLFDGDEYSLTPGEDFGTVNAFRVRLHRMTRARGLRYASRMNGDRLELIIYRHQIGDLFKENYPEAADAAPEPLPGQ